MNNKETSKTSLDQIRDWVLSKKGFFTGLWLSVGAMLGNSDRIFEYITPALDERYVTQEQFVELKSQIENSPADTTALNAKVDTIDLKVGELSKAVNKLQESEDIISDLKLFLEQKLGVEPYEGDQEQGGLKVE